MNTNDQAQPAKDMYQFPMHSIEAGSIDVAIENELSDEQIDRQFTSIAREEVSRRFDEISRELAMAASGVEAPIVSPIETITTNPHAVELLHLGSDIKSKRQAHLQESNEVAQKKRLFHRSMTAFFSINPSESKKFKKSQAEIMHDLIDFESNVVAKISNDIFGIDKDVQSRKFIYMPNENYDEWLLRQKSTVKSKDFTISYPIRPTGIEKSSTYYDEIEGQIKNVLTVPSEAEIIHLKKAVGTYHVEVSNKIYTKPSFAQRRLGL
jgi:hypothetical protein